MGLSTFSAVRAGGGACLRIVQNQLHQDAGNERLSIAGKESAFLAFAASIRCDQRLGQRVAIHLERFRLWVQHGERVDTVGLIRVMREFLGQSFLERAEHPNRSKLLSCASGDGEQFNFWIEDYERAFLVFHDQRRAKRRHLASGGGGNDRNAVFADVSDYASFTVFAEPTPFPRLPPVRPATASILSEAMPAVPCETLFCEMSVAGFSRVQRSAWSLPVQQ